MNGLIKMRKKSTILEFFEFHNECFHKIVDERAIVEQVATGFHFTEGPVWNSREGFLLFSDINANKILKWTSQGTTTYLEPSGKSNGLTYDFYGNLVICEQENRRVSCLDANGKYWTLADKFNEKQLNSPNDVVVRSDGLVYFSDPPYGIGGGSKDRKRPKLQELSFQGVFCLNIENEELTLVTRDMIRPNGLAFSPAEDLLYVSDSHLDTRHIRAFEIKFDGTFKNSWVFAEVRTEKQGVPDGIKVDKDGNLYVADTSGIWVFSAKGVSLGKIRLPEAPSNIAWGDYDLKSLFITARTSLYRVRLKIEGANIPGFR